MKYRKLRKYELVKEGDEFKTALGTWIKSNNWPGVQDDLEYRRPQKQRKVAKRATNSVSPTSCQAIDCTNKASIQLCDDCFDKINSIVRLRRQA
jgi:hypothetical protein